MTKKAKSAPLLAPTAQEQLLGGVYLAVELVVLPEVLRMLGDQFGGFSDSTANLIYYLTNALCCCLIFRSLLKDSLIQAGAHFGRLLGASLAGFLLLLGANQLMTGIALALRPEFVNLNNAAVSAMVSENPLLMTIGTVVLVPIGEECLFRGLLFLSALPKSRHRAYALSVIFFCAVHVVGYLGQGDMLTLALCFVQYVPAGLVLAAVCERTGTLFAPMLIHAAVNASAIVFLDQY